MTMLVVGVVGFVVAVAAYLSLLPKSAVEQKGDDPASDRRPPIQLYVEWDSVQLPGKLPPRKGLNTVVLTSAFDVAPLHEIQPREEGYPNMQWAGMEPGMGWDGSVFRFFNHGPVLFNVTITLDGFFNETIEESPGVRRGGKTIVTKTWSITIPRIDSTPSVPYELHFANLDEGYFLRLELRDTATALSSGESDRREVQIVKPQGGMKSYLPASMLPLAIVKEMNKERTAQAGK